MKGKNRFLKGYTILLAAFTVITALDTFVLTKAYEVVETAAAESSRQESYSARSSGRRSNMLGAWTLPALCAVFLLIAAKSFDPLPGNALLQLQACGAATLTAGFLMKGVLDIYGTTNRLTVFYSLAGGLLTFLFAVSYGLGLTASRRKQSSAVLSPEEETNIIEKKEERGI